MGAGPQKTPRRKPRVSDGERDAGDLSFPYLFPLDALCPPYAAEVRGAAESGTKGRTIFQSDRVAFFHGGPDYGFRMKSPDGYRPDGRPTRESSRILSPACRKAGRRPFRKAFAALGSGQGTSLFFLCSPSSPVPIVLNTDRGQRTIRCVRYPCTSRNGGGEGIFLPCPSARIRNCRRCR